VDPPRGRLRGGSSSATPIGAARSAGPNEGAGAGSAEFTATLKDDKLTIDDSASQAGTGLGDQERTSIELCTDDRFRPASG